MKIVQKKNITINVSMFHEFQIKHRVPQLEPRSILFETRINYVGKGTV